MSHIHTEEMEQIEHLRSREANALALLHQAADVRLCRYPIDLGRGLAWAHPYLRAIAGSESLLLLESVSHAYKADGAGATESVAALLALADSLARQPIAASHALHQ